MTKANITQYSSTPSSNADINDINIAENCPASGLNNAIRELMAHLKNVDTGSQALTALSVAGSVTATTSLKTPLIEFTDGDNALTIADGGNVTANANLTVSGAFTSQGIDDNADATAITIDSSENVTLTGALSAKGGAVFNEDSASVDFRVEANGVANMFLVDGTNQKVKVKTDQTVSTSSAETFVVDAGTAGGYAGVFASQTSGGFSCLYLKTNSNVSNFAFFVRDTSVVGSITTNGSTTSFNTSSDYRLKENVDYTFDATTRLKQLKPARFNFIADADTTVDGFLAHEVQSVVPEAITGTHNEVDADGNPVMQGIDQSKLVPLLVKTIQELEARITALENA